MARAGRRCAASGGRLGVAPGQGDRAVSWEIRQGDAMALLVVAGQIWRQVPSTGAWWTIEDCGPGLYRYAYSDDPTRDVLAPAGNGVDHHERIEMRTWLSPSHPQRPARSSNSSTSEEKEGRRMSGCWLWTGSITSHGYGQLWWGSERWLAHRLTWTMLVGSIPEEKQLDHVCRVRSCVNPAHLRLVSSRENTLATGSRAPSARNALKAACPKCGNPYISRSSDTGWRRCGPCGAVAHRLARARRRAAALGPAGRASELPTVAHCTGGRGYVRIARDGLACLACGSPVRLAAGCPGPPRCTATIHRKDTTKP
jgi:hypothetical protein